MGHGSYSVDSRMLRSTSLGYDTKSSGEIFSSNINSAMNPMDIDVRESRDSNEHPNSVPIILGLDVTGSMGSIPRYLVKEGLPHMMDKIIKGGVLDPQVLFLGIGDHECDRAPLQVGQFESSDALLDHWLTKLFIEGGGGANIGESYLLAWYFASKFVKADHITKRNKKGLIFTIGDEPTLDSLPADAQKEIVGGSRHKALTAKKLLETVSEHFEVFHIHMLQGSNGKKQSVKDGWTKLIGDNLLCVQSKEEVAQVIADHVIEVVHTQLGDMTPGRFDDLT